MDTFDQVRKLLARAFGISEEIITLQSTIGDLARLSLTDRPLDKIASSDSIVDRLSPDSLSMVEFFMALEEAFDLEMPDKEVEVLTQSWFDKNTTVQSIVDDIDRWLTGGDL